MIVKASGAIFSPDRRYRYALWRIWDESKGVVAFIGINPSIADETIDDPTQRRCRRFALDWRFGSYFMLNLFGLVSTDPKKLKTVADPVGPETDAYLQGMTRLSDLTVVAWGRYGSFMNRGAEVLKTLQVIKPLMCLGQNEDGSPCHPLYLKACTQIRPLNIIKL